MNTSPKEAKSRGQQWPFIRFSAKEHAWKVDARTKDGGSRRFFSTKGEAETFAQQCRTQKENSGTSSFGNADLAEFGKTVQNAIDFYVAHLRAQKKSLSIEAAIAQLVSSRRSAGREERYCNEMELRLTRFAGDHVGTMVASFEARHLDKWLSDLNLAPGSRNTYRRDLRTLFSYCQKHGYCQSNEAAKTERATDIDKPAGILKPNEAAALLGSCASDTLPYVAIGLFGGLRRSELQKLDWSEVDLESGHIEVTAKKAKTKKRRLVPISENLAAWLRSVATLSGPIAPVGLRKRFAVVRAKAGLDNWPQNAMRHSFGSYRLAQCHDAARVSLEMGNSPQMVFAHYRELVKPKDAARYWEIKPNTDTAKVVAFAAS